MILTSLSKKINDSNQNSYKRKLKTETNVGLPILPEIKNCKENMMSNIYDNVKHGDYCTFNSKSAISTH